MILTLVRHTQVDVPSGYCYGQSDVLLKESFEEEAALVADALSSLQFDAVYTSVSSRCTRLAAACGFADAVLEPRLMELNFGDWELQAFDEISDPHLQCWFEDHINLPASGGESFMQQIARVGQFIDQLKREGLERALLFTHGGSIRAAYIHAKAYSPSQAFDHKVDYGSIHHLEF